MTLTDFLLARIAEDEAAAQTVPPLDYNIDMGGNRQDERWMFDRALPSSADGMGNWSKNRGRADADHFSRWDPARVLAECEAKRRIVEIHREVPASDIDWSDCALCPTGLTRTRWPCPTLRALALPYAAHPDYREEWRP